ncbi:B3 domain-containing protein Os07g0563300-like isoform X2 [Andrographis paniculata]|uniref:B3 domain-containing protein Os07g0563300-like isoform X2 n=1 Tax=Andrographis paniculata TaxID=175694 RepID=UPI0021E95D54|nr:B3 domain-containing protein Os07g0563300-like isoform X2 [Andrographis paniculata]
MMSSSTATKVCFNSGCKEVSENWRRGWRRRTGDYARLCDRCASAYEDGKFCETFHSKATGWRCCESCGKQIHCGCIVSFHMFVLLDAGGIECLTCAKKSYILTPNPAWPPPSHFLPSQPETVKDISVKTWSTVANSGQMPWHQAPSLFSGSDTHSRVQQRMPFEINESGSNDRYHIGDKLSTAPFEMKQRYERLVPGINMKEPSFTFINDLNPLFPKNDDSSSNLSLATAASSRIETDDAQLSSIFSKSQAYSLPVGKQVSHSMMDPSGEVQLHNEKARGDVRGRNLLLPRYRPQMSNKELQQISSNSKSVITPLFEKMLSASDAGRIGRLVLPKKCAEAYFPPICHPEGLPLKVLDVKGKEWVFQFRFWPNNNSRMYVLEGITPCIQSMELQAGDVVTFSRLEPEGKLVMGGRKASAIHPSDQVYDALIAGSDTSTPGDSSARNSSADVLVNGHIKEKVLDDKIISHSKRKNGNIPAKNKRLRFENDDVIDLKLTWKEAQMLLRAPAKTTPSLIIVDGFEFEEFEEAAPVIGRPTIPGVDHFGEKIQWLQCEDCFKWRKVPADALLPARWTCAENVWDLDRSACSAVEDLTKEQLDHMLLTMNSSKREESADADQDPDLIVALEAFDPPVLAIQDDGEGPHASSENRPKHPRHKTGCTCIVCFRPPSVRGSKHKQSCECVVCTSLRLRFKTLMEKEEKKQFKIEAESSLQNSKPKNAQAQAQDADKYTNTYTLKSSASSLKGKIDLNIQPEREEDSSPGSDPGNMKSAHPSSSDRFFLQQGGSLGSNVIGDLIEKQIQQEDRIGAGSSAGTGFISCSIAMDGHNKKTV